MRLREHRRDEFFARWRRWYKVVYRRVTGAKQFLPADYATRVSNFKSLLRSMSLEKRYTTFVPMLTFCLSVALDGLIVRPVPLYCPPPPPILSGWGVQMGGGADNKGEGGWYSEFNYLFSFAVFGSNEFSVFFVHQFYEYLTKV